MELAPIAFGDPTAKDHREFRRLADRAIRIEEALAESVQSRAAAEDEIVTVFHLREEEAVLTPMLALARRKERREGRQPLLAAALQIMRGERVRQGLQPTGIVAAQERVRAWSEGDALRPHLGGEPVMLVETDARRERKIRTHPHKHPAPLGIVDIEVVVHHPALGEGQVPAVLGLLADRDESACRFPRLENGDHLIGLGVPEIGLDEFVARLRRRIEDRHVPAHGSVRHPVVVLPGDVAEQIATDRILVTVRAEKPDDALRLLKGLDQAVEKNPIETPVRKANAILMMLVEGVHVILQGGERP